MRMDGRTDMTKLTVDVRNSSPFIIHVSQRDVTDKNIIIHLSQFRRDI